MIYNFTVTINFMKKCSVKIYDNLLVEADIFTILGVSFCVIQNVFNLIKIKNNNVREQFIKSSMPLRNHFFKLMKLLVTLAPHNFFLVATAPLSFLMDSG